MHRVLKQKVAVDEFRVCFHTDEDRCDCRKPKPGMLVTCPQLLYHFVC